MDDRPVKTEAELLAEIDELETQIVDEMAVVLAAIARSIYAKEIEMNITHSCNLQLATA
jgi:hypothetical protein